MDVYITPVSKPRQTRADVWQQRPAVMKYRAFADELRLLFPYTCPNSVKLTFHMPMPKSWSKKKREEMLGKPHQQTPDIDNLAKAVLDALLEQDCQVYHLNATKVWGREGMITIEEIW